jgi:hypothetical protein
MFNIFIPFYTYKWTYICHSYIIYATICSPFILLRLFDIAEEALEIHWLMSEHFANTAEVPSLLEWSLWWRRQQGRQ